MLLQHHRLREHKLHQLRQIDALSPNLSTPSSAPSWSAWTFFSGLLSSISINGGNLGSAGSRPDDEQEDPDLFGADANCVDPVLVQQEGIQALHAFAERLESADIDEETLVLLNGSSSAAEPGQLEAVAFALTHTILSLPVDSAASSDADLTIERPPSLRQCVEESPALSKWTRSMYAKYIKGRTLA